MEWKKLYVLGTGSYGKVYYAVKIDSFSLSASVAAVKCADINRSISLQQEAQILTTLNGCPHVVQFFGADISIDDGNIPTYNLFLEYACGGSLHDLINSKRGITKMSELEVGCYAYQLLKGIQHVHTKGWVHCDIKPANVLVFDNANINERGGMHKLKLADFGLSLRVGDGMAYMTGRTLSNRGTLLYAPPESLTHGFHSKAYDIWSLGCTVAEMMTGNHVWIYRNSTKDLQWQIMNEDPIIPNNVSEIARDFLYKCFIKDPRRRWTSEQLLQHPFIQRSLCTSTNSMPETQGRIARVNPFGCQVPLPEKDFISLLFESSLRIQ
ncbi:mitogen-activated protein kinase kinase kinase 20-like [Lycium ferocissimum]|uniref:mitogen-activated protein kinase kinase kinase 20-like n=1 Tax=Lycium ferocissimum TaxID=112874 RepID=UPI0028162ED7|nr:mitogen-activated protein kinase kinase kinase 20-like [Lycium ferocissimum]